MKEERGFVEYVLEIIFLVYEMVMTILRIFILYTITANVYRGLRGVCRFFLQYLWKRAVRITKGKIVYFVGKPCNIYRLRGMLQGFPTTYTIFPFEE